jgi:hypothetical protein
VVIDSFPESFFLQAAPNGIGELFRVEALEVPALVDSGFSRIERLLHKVWAERVSLLRCRADSALRVTDCVSEFLLINLDRHIENIDRVVEDNSSPLWTGAL